MKVLTLGMGAFGFAINKVLGENNPNKEFFVYEKKREVVESIENTRRHPYFFEGYKLPGNIKFVKNYGEILSDIDLFIIAIPAQFINAVFEGLEYKLKPGVIIMNLAKGIDVKSNKTISQILLDKFSEIDYDYAILSGGMIALEVVEGKQLGADLGIRDFNKGEQIRSLFNGSNLKIELRKDVLNIELYGSLKNIMAILVGYYEGKGNSFSTIGFHLINFYNEMKDLIWLYDGNPTLDFAYYSLGGDMVATCFGSSRNRYFGYLLGKGMRVEDVIIKLKSENKHAEGYETLKAVYKMIENKDGFDNVKLLYNLIK